MTDAKREGEWRKEHQDFHLFSRIVLLFFKLLVTDNWRYIWQPDLDQNVKGVLNPNFRPFSFELNKQKIDFLKWILI